ncbi:MAG: hypothetical protein JWR02_1745, partial [Mucilaginibacter sp.]|nr:hypothetical protein [Mucilaginibacter sp.]
NRWWRSTNTLALYYNRQQMPYLGNIYAIPVRDLSYAGSQIFSLPKGWIADMSYRYQSKTGSSLYIQQPYGSLDLGLQKKWLSGRLTSRLNAYDLFYTQITDLTFREKSIIDNRLTHRSATRRVVLSLQYDLGKSAYKPKTGKTSDEEKRVAQ